MIIQKIERQKKLLKCFYNFFIFIDSYKKPATFSIEKVAGFFSLTPLSQIIS